MNNRNRKIAEKRLFCLGTRYANSFSMGTGKPKPVAEHEATREIERVYHEIKQILRIFGVNLNFRTWAGYGNFLPVVMWDRGQDSGKYRDQGL